MDVEPKPTDRVARREGTWAEPVSKLRVASVPPGAVNLNVDGRPAVGPLQGFGQLWQKTYRARLSGAEVTPAEVVKAWRANFQKYWPKGNRFHGALTGITPGDVALLDLAIAGPMRLSTGVRVIYADDESFSFMTPRGHMFAAFITFSAFEEDGSVVAQVQPLIRATDPLYEVGCRLGVVNRMEDRFWCATLRALAMDFGVDAQVQQQQVLIDPRVQWSEVKNIWDNAAVRTGAYIALSPVRWALNAVRRPRR